MTERWRLINGTELYEIRADPAQEHDVADQHPRVVAELRAAYERWWKELEPYFVPVTRFVLGAEEENPVRLTAHDWHAPDAQVPWDQTHIRNPDFTGNGFWTVEIARRGTYEFILRPRPYPVDEPIRAGSAGITVAGVEQAQRVRPGAFEVRFQAELPAGETELQTWLGENDRSRGGAYYVYVRRMST